MIPEITRQQFIEAIEYGIRLAPSMPDEERDALREVGRTATLVARGTFLYERDEGNVCCPLSCIGADPEDPDKAQWVGQFFSAYDDATGRLFEGVGPRPKLLRVVG